MNIYFLNIVIVILASFICKCNIKGIFGKKIEGKKVYDVIVCSTFIFIMALRDVSVGVDTASYSRIFRTIANTSSFLEAIKNAPLTAPAYVVFCKVLSYISKDPQILIVVSAVIINVGLVRLVEKVSDNATISYLLWIGLALFYCSMNGTRQCMALVISLHALVILSDDIKSKKGWGLFLLAILLHSTALILLIAIAGMLLAEKTFDPKVLFVTSGIVSLVIALGYGMGVKLVLRFIPRYAMYATGGSQYSIFNSTGGGRIVFLYLFLFVINILWLLKTYSTVQYEKSFIEKMLPAVLFGTVFGIINSKNELINRLLWYYLGIYIIFIPDALRRYRKRERWILTAGIIGVLLIYSILSLNENQNGVVPYIFWSEQK